MLTVVFQSLVNFRTWFVMDAVSFFFMIILSALEKGIVCCRSVSSSCFASTIFINSFWLVVSDESAESFSSFSVCYLVSSSLLFWWRFSCFRRLFKDAFVESRSPLLPLSVLPLSPSLLLPSLPPSLLL